MEKKTKNPAKRPVRKLKSTSRRKKAYTLVVNLSDFGSDPELSTRLAQRLQNSLRRSGWDCFTHFAEDWGEFEKMIALSIRKKPFAIVVFGGDGTVRLAASRISRAKGLIGIVPTGLNNNIFQSLYGHVDADDALNIVRSGYQTRIDTGTANGSFFLGSLATGTVAQMIKNQDDKPLPKMAMSWTKMASKAANQTIPQTMTIKVESYTIKSQPLILNIHLLPHLMTLPIAPAAVPDDGYLVIVYDENGTSDGVSHYIRDLKKNKYQYHNTIRMVRGHHISISPAEGRTWMMDSEEVEFAGKELIVEVRHRILRVFSNAPQKK